MKSKKTALSIIVIVLAFCIGYVTYQVAGFVGGVLLGSSTDCRQQKEVRNCSEQKEKPFADEVPGY